MSGLAEMSDLSDRGCAEAAGAGSHVWRYSSVHYHTTILAKKKAPTRR